MQCDNCYNGSLYRVKKRLRRTADYARKNKERLLGESNTETDF